MDFWESALIRVLIKLNLRMVDHISSDGVMKLKWNNLTPTPRYMYFIYNYLKN